MPVTTRLTTHRTWRQRHRRIMLVLDVVMVKLAFGTALALWIAANPAIIPDLVDRARAVFGPVPVAQVEGLMAQATDVERRLLYQTTGNTQTVTWAAPATTVEHQAIAPTSARLPLPTTVPAAPDQSAPGVPVLPTTGTSAPAATDHSKRPPPALSLPAALLPVAPNWLPYVSAADGTTVLERAFLLPDPTRPYATAAVVRIDLRKAQLHLIAGTAEPASSVHVARPGSIPTRDVQTLLAAFNGGFKAANGHFGMRVNGVTLLAPQDGLATLALYRDGSVRMGVWGQDIRQTPDLVAFRQNCPPLVDHGRVTVLAQSDDTTLWGKTVHNKIATWRSGLGLSADGRYLYYAVGDGLTVPSLAQTLVMAGAARGMQLDINGFWTRFDTYTHTTSGATIAARLLNQMLGDTHQFLTADSRDFFYLTSRS